MRKIILSLGVSAALLFGIAATSVEENETKSFEVAGFSITNPLANVRFGNPIDPSTWWEGAEATDAPLVFNFADPEFYINIINPKTHSNIHKGITNPETWAQFMKLETYTNMIDTKVWAKWFQAKTYDPLLDAQTYAYWMQPGAFGHHLEADRFTNLINPDAYATIVDAMLSNVGYSFKIPSDALSFDGWMNSVTESSAEKQDS